MNEIKVGALAPLGFSGAGISCGIKKSGNKDLSIVFSEKRASASAVFTKNIAKASPVLISEEHIEDGIAQAVVLSSGNANAANGPEGDEVSHEMCKKAAGHLKIKTEDVLIAQTGLIGIPLDKDVAVLGVEKALNELSPYKGEDSAAAMMTTDTFPKMYQKTISISGKEVTVGGMAKGAAMLAPSMATMLAVITSDGDVSPSASRSILKKAVSNSFNMMVVDGCMSTNDTVFFLSNGMSECQEIVAESEEYYLLEEAVTEVCTELAKMMAKDGEGSNKYFTMKVQGASSTEDAKLAAKQVVSSLLVKCSIAGESQYWGRVLAELGASGASFDPRNVDIFYGKIQVCQKGMFLKHPEDQMSEYMKNKEIEITANLNSGSMEAEAYGCDITQGYLEENMGRS